MVTPLPGGREPIPCDILVAYPWSYRAIRLVLNNGHVIYWDIKELFRYDHYYNICYLVLASGRTDEECDLSSNFLRIAYG